MMDRVDPFFNTKKPHTNNYLETLHRTYGEPKGALPKRDEAVFQRAMKFRMDEKAHYAHLEKEMKKTELENKAIVEQNKLLTAETEKMHVLFEKLSRAETNGVVTRDGSDST